MHLADPPDPGTPRRAALASLAVVMLIVLTAVLQRTEESALERAAPLRSDALVSPPGVQFRIMARVGVQIWHVRPDQRLAHEIVQTLDRQAHSTADRLRVAMVAGELLGSEALARRLATLERDLPPDSPLWEDLDTLRSLPQAPPAQIEALIARHGWFGRLAATRNLDAEYPQRAAVIGGGKRLIIFAMLLLAGGAVSLVAGLVLLVLGLAGIASGSLTRAFRPPRPGGSAAIETVALFVAAFLGLKGASAAVTVLGGEQAATVFSLWAQWVLAAALLWPVARGLDLRRTLALWGLHRGQGVLRELGWGIVGYVALLPLLLLGLLASLAASMLYDLARRVAGAPPAPAPHNPVIELLGGETSPAVLVMIVLLASVWAPLVEEGVFRGALYRHLRARWTVPTAGLLSALAFGLMHGYALVLLGPVVALGLGFALLREWRGCLIAPITAHAVHNLLVMTLIISARHLLGD